MKEFKTDVKPTAGRNNKSLLILPLLAVVIALCAFINREPALPHLPVKYQASVNVALNKSGENRPELVRALAGISRDRLPAMCDIISRMPNYDLTNITSAMLIDHVDSTFDILSKVPWKTPDTKSQLFLDYVLPYRVYCESLDNSRGTLSSFVLPHILSCKSQIEAIEAIIRICDNPTVVKDFMGSAFPYDYTPTASWQHGFQANSYYNCRARTLLLVAMLRSVGIPACETDRLATAAVGSSHACFLWYDTTSSTWRIHGPDIRTGDQYIKGLYQWWGEVIDYSIPPYMSADYLGRHRFDKLNQIGTFNAAHGNLTVQVDVNGLPARDAVVGVYTWNVSTQNWYNVAIAKSNQSGEAAFPLGFNNHCSPYMVTASKGKQSGIGFVSLSGDSHPSEALQLSLTESLNGYPEMTSLDIREEVKDPQ